MACFGWDGGLKNDSIEDETKRFELNRFSVERHRGAVAFSEMGNGGIVVQVGLFVVGFFVSAASSEVLQSAGQGVGWKFVAMLPE